MFDYDQNYGPRVKVVLSEVVSRIKIMLFENKNMVFAPELMFNVRDE